MRRRLADHYKEERREIWILTIESADVEVVGLCKRVRRSRFASFEPCVYRLGNSRAAIVAIGERPAVHDIRALRAKTFRLSQIGPDRKPRAFRNLTRGVVVPRGDYGAWADRFYHRSLAKHATQTFIVQLRGGIRKRHPEAKAGVRAWRRGSWLQASPVTAGREAVDLIIKRDRSLNGRRCTHAKCSADRCLYAKPERARKLPINQVARGSAPSYSVVPGILAAGGASIVPHSIGSRTVAPGVTAPPASSIPKTNRDSIPVGRDAGSAQVSPTKWQLQLERFANLGKPKPENST